MRVSIIAAIGNSDQLGKDNQLLWHHSSDLKNFKKVTQGHAVLMGRKTFESIGRALPKRHNIVITKNGDYKSDGITVHTTFQAGIDDAFKNNCSELFIIGGGTIYEQAMNICQRLYITHVDYSGEADTFFPQIDRDRFSVVEEYHLNGNPSAQFKVYQLKERL